MRLQTVIVRSGNWSSSGDASCLRAHAIEVREQSEARQSEGVQSEGEESEKRRVRENMREHRVRIRG